MIERGRQHRDPAAARIVDEDRQLFGLVHVETHRGSVEFFRVMRLEPRGLVGEQRIGGGVRLVETVAGELVDQIEQRIGLGLLDPADFLAPGDEAFALDVHFGLDLLAHRAAQQIGVAERIAGKDLRRLHHLFLVDEDAVGLRQDAFELGMRKLDRDLARLALAEQRDVVHRARAVERDERDDVAEIGRLHCSQRAPHAFRFELEHAHRVARLHQFVDLGIVERQLGQVDVDLAPLEQVDRLLEHRQRLEPEEVELDQSRALDILHVVLRHRHVRARIAVERHQLGQRPVADHHPRRMGRAVAREAFELHRQVDEPLHLVVVVVFVLEIGGAIERAWQRPRVGRVIGHHLA